MTADSPEHDLAVMIALAKAQIEKKPLRYYPGLELAYAQTIAFMAENWIPKDEGVWLVPVETMQREKP